MTVFYKSYTKFIFYIVVLVWAIFPQIITAQEVFTRKIDFDEGLFSRSIYSMFVDSRGLLYLATSGGMLSYDGVRFREFPMKGNLAMSVARIQEDEDGNIWCKNFVNQIFKLENDTLVAHSAANKIIADEGRNLVDFLVRNQQLWILTEKSLWLHQKYKAPHKVLNLNNNGANDAFTSLLYDSVEIRIVIGSILSVYEVDVEGNSFSTAVPHGQKELTQFGSRIFYIIKGNENQIFTTNGQRFHLPKDAPKALFIRLSVADGTLWLGTGKGFYRFDTLQQQFIFAGLENRRVTDLVSDHEGNIWISTLEHGLYFMPAKSVIRIFDTKNPEFIYTRIIVAPNGNLLAATGNGNIVEFDANRKVVKRFRSRTDLEIEHISIHNEQIYSSVGVFDRNNPQRFQPQYLGKDMAPDNLGNFAVASYNMAGITSQNQIANPNLHPEFSKQSIEKFGNSQSFIYILRNKRAGAIGFCPEAQTYLVGYSDGLCVYDSLGNQTEIRFSNGEPIVATQILTLKNNRSWISTTRSGVVEIAGNKVITVLNQEAGLQSNQARRIASDDSGLWIATNRSIEHYSFQSGKIQNVSLHLGLKGLRVNDIGVDDRNIFLATDVGIITAPKTVLQKSANPSVSIGKVTVNGKNITDRTRFSAHENNMEFHLKALFYKSLSDFSFEYRLDGYQTEWQMQNSHVPVVNYLALKHGKYTFYARIRFADVESNVVEYQFHIEKPIWLRAWFIGLQILALCIVLILVYRWAATRTKRKQQVREQLILSQLKALRSQMNPHFLYNVLTSVQGLVYSNQKAKATEYLGNFSDLMRHTLDNSDKHEISIQQELDTIKLYLMLEKERFEAGSFHFSFLIPDGVDLSMFAIPSLIVQPYVENAIKHGLLHKQGRKELKIEISEHSGRFWRFVIEDNGIGRQASEAINQKVKKHRSFATAATAGRVALINKLNRNHIEIEITDLKTKENQPSGTKVTLIIPKKEI